jgi:hypothetical protein
MAQFVKPLAIPLTCRERHDFKQPIYYKQDLLGWVVLSYGLLSV